MLNADGGINTDKLIEKFIDFGRRQASGGAVLLKNQADAQGKTSLPLASGADVTLLGVRSHIMLQGAGFGMPIKGPVISFEDALSKSRTDFGNPKRLSDAKDDADYSTLTNFDFDGAGYNLNEAMIDIYEKYNESLDKDTKLWPTGIILLAGFRY